ncbi:MAG: ATP-binding protein [Verrucomicrobiota bacterium]
MKQTDPGTVPSGRILFVDDEPMLLSSIERTLLPMRQHWECEYVGDAAAALRRLKAGAFHVVVSDMRMPVMNGAELLARAATIAPDTVRVMLTGNADFDTAMEAVNEGHVFQFLLKPCDGGKLIQSLTAALRQHELQQAQRELSRARIEHAEKMSVIGQLAAGINHDLNNILQGIMLHSELALLNTTSAPPAVTNTFGLIKEAAGRAAELTRELNGFSRTDSEAKFRQVDVRQLIDTTTRMVRPMMKKQIELQVGVAEGLPPVLGDTGKLKQILLNLLINSRDAMSGKGCIRIAAELCAGRPQQVCLSVTDNGCGMDEATQKRLFEPFFTTKEVGKGTGLGLFMILQLVEQHHGSLEVESAVGRGTTFRLFLPVVEDQHRQAA